MGTITNNDNATQVLAALNDAFSGEGIQEILASDNAATLIEKLNHNFEVMGEAGSGVFPEGTILSSSIGSLDAGIDIGGMTIDDFIAYGIQNKPHKLTFIHMSDPHGQIYTVNKAKDEMDNDTDIKFLIITGDMNCDVSSNLSTAMQSQGVGNKLLAVVGNHDLSDNAGYNSATGREHMETWIGNNVTFGNNVQDEDDNKIYGSYWHKDYTLGKGKLRVIGLDQYDYPKGSSPSNYANCITQKQVNWFVGLLDGLTEDDYFIVAMHEPPLRSNTNPLAQSKRRLNKFCSSRLASWAIRSSDGTFFPAIVDAYVNSKSVEKGHDDLSVHVTADEDFSGKSPAKFLGYLCGHVHADFVGPHNEYPNQLIMLVDCALNYANIADSDIRTTDEGNERSANYLCNKVTIDVLKETIHIERIGQQETCTHTVNSANWDGDSNDPHGDGHVYAQVTRDEITFGFDLVEITNTNTEEQENEE